MNRLAMQVVERVVHEAGSHFKPKPSPPEYTGATPAATMWTLRDGLHVGMKAIHGLIQITQ